MCAQTLHTMQAECSIQLFKIQLSLILNWSGTWSNNQMKWNEKSSRNTKSTTAAGKESKNNKKKKWAFGPKIEQKNLCTLGILTWFFFSFNLRHCPRNWIHLFVFAWEKKKSRYISCAWVCNVQKRVPDDNPKTTKIECFCDSATFETKWFWLHFWSSACCCSRQFMVLRCSHSAYYHTYLSTKRQKNFFTSKNRKMWIEFEKWTKRFKKMLKNVTATANSMSWLYIFFAFWFFFVFQLFVVLLFRWRIKCDPKMLHVFDTLQRWWIIKQIKKKVYPSHGFKAWNAVMRYIVVNSQMK